MPISKILELYARNGRSLIDYGLNEAALPVADANLALELFSQQKWCVLGGDVYQLTQDGRFAPTHENWFYKGKSVDESIAVARHFVSGIASQSLYVVFVVGDRE